MKKIFAIAIAAVLCLGTFSCTKDGAYPEGADMTSLRVSVTPDPGTVPAIGSEFEAAVVVHQGPVLDVAWNVSVDGNPDWITVKKIRYKSNFTGTYSGDDVEVEQDGIACAVLPNGTGKKRSANIRFTVDDGRSIIRTINQAAK
ncbi:MAG: hypothetical protein J6O51_02850 [Bacteroidales bacterium]|nr:hypothetical protein [Bacteroidales bacterium]